MPNRYIRASAIESEAVNALTPSAEVFWRRLLNRVDDFGRFTANPSLLRATLYPLQLSKVSEKAITENLKLCERMGLLFTYKDGEKELLAMNKWENGRAAHSDYMPPPESVCIQMKTYVYSRKHKCAAAPDSDPDPDSETDTVSDKGVKFVPPLPHEVETYSRQIGYPMDGQAWCDSYAQKNWMIGKTKMKDWKAAVRNWKSQKWSPSKQSGAPGVSNPWDQEPEGWRAYWRNKYPPEDFPDAVRHDEKQWLELSSYDRKLIYQGMNSTRKEIQLESQ